MVSQPHVRATNGRSGSSCWRHTPSRGVVRSRLLGGKPAELVGVSAEEFRTEFAERGAPRDAGFLEPDEREETLDALV